MRTTALAVVMLVFLNHPAAAEELTKQKMEDIRHLMQLTGAMKIGKQFSEYFVRQMSDAIKTARPDLPAEAFDILADEVNSLIDDELNAENGLMPLLFQIYHKYFTHGEIKQMIDFNNTPLGQKIIKVMPELTRESMLAGQEWGKSLGPILEMRIRNRMNKEGYEL